MRRMDPKFAELVETLAPKLEELLAMKPLRHGNIPMTLPMKGVYLFSKGRKHLYVGRSNMLRKRFHRHFTHPRGAAFAFLLARKETGRKRNYKKNSGGTRAELMKDPVFKRAFDEARKQMREMDYRCVGEDDPTRQALLEIYCATVLNTEFNDFDNH
jgi:hypothetical protein